MDDKAIQPLEGVAALERVLTLERVAQVAVSTWDLELRLAQWVRSTPAAMPQGPRHTAGSPDQDESGEAHLEQQVLRLLRDALGRPEVALHDNIFELGGDSLLMVRLLAEVREAVGVEVPLAEALNDPTGATLVRLIETRRRAVTDDLDEVLSQFDEWTLERLLHEVEGLDDAEAQAALDETAFVHRDT